MPASFHQLPTVSDPRPQPMSAGRVMGSFALLAAMTWPRVTILVFWIFTDLLGDTYDGWVVPVLGFLALPWATMTYAVMWSVSSDAVAGAEWVLVVLAVLLDLLIWAGVRSLR